VTASWSTVTSGWRALVELAAPSAVIVLHVTPSGNIARLTRLAAGSRGLAASLLAGRAVQS
jgi:hypothetical protein